MPLFTRDQLYNPSNTAYTQALFKETAREAGTAIMTLDIKNDPVLPCLRELYIEHTVLDPSEATFVEEVFGYWGFWQKLREFRAVVSRLPEWREEADAKRKAMAFKAMAKEIQEGGKSAFSAAKFLIERPDIPKTKRAVREQEAKTTRLALDSVDDDMKRLQEGGFLPNSLQ